MAMNELQFFERIRAIKSARDLLAADLAKALRELLENPSSHNHQVAGRRVMDAWDRNRQALSRLIADGDAMDRGVTRS